ncbi:MAG: HipA N-terminal domain-containing protein [Pseudomonadota bacterium]
MRKAMISVHGIDAGILEEISSREYRFAYLEEYKKPAISMSMPTDKRIYEFDRFPPFFDGLLPEGFQLEALLKTDKIDKDDFFTQLVTVGADLVGAVTVREIT